MRFKIEQLKHYSIMPNSHLRDKNLSLKAKGLLSIFFSLPDDWDYSMNGLIKITGTKITTLRSTIAELELKGYIKRMQKRNEKGQFEYIYVVPIEPYKGTPKNCTSLKRFAQQKHININTNRI